MLLKIVYYFVIADLALSVAVGINKCCSENQTFRLVNNELFCENVTIDYLPQYFWLPENTSEIVLEDLEVNFNNIPCSIDQATLTDNINLSDNGSSILNEDRGVTYSEKSFCMESLSENQVIAYECPCIEKVCINKCCQEGEHLQKNDTSLKCIRSGNVPDWNYTLIDDASDGNFYVMYNRYPKCMKNKKSQYLVSIYSLLENGSIDSDVDGIINPDEYCGDYMQVGDGSRTANVIACIEEYVITTESKIYGTIVLIGAFFLFITAIIQFWMPEMGGSPMWSLPIQVSCLLVAYLSLAYQQLSPSYFGIGFCKFIGFLMQFSFLASFFWLNVMCIDLSWTFSRVRAPSHHKRWEKKKFIWYSMYAWSGPLLLTLAALIVESSPSVSIKSHWKPNFGLKKCFFRDSTSLWLYFFGPIGILLLTNVILFIFTTIRIIILKRGTKALRRDDNVMQRKTQNKRSYMLFVKLFMLMGVSWLTEIISSAVGDENVWGYVWYITDTINLMRALFIFIVFCCNKKVWLKLKNKMPWLNRWEVMVLNMCCKTTQTDDAFNSEKKTDSTSGGTSRTTSEVPSLDNVFQISVDNAKNKNM